MLRNIFRQLRLACAIADLKIKHKKLLISTYSGVVEQVSRLSEHATLKVYISVFIFSYIVFIQRYITWPIPFSVSALLFLLLNFVFLGS